MHGPETRSRDLRSRLRCELIEYGLNVAYLAPAFAVFTMYRRPVLAVHDIAYTNYWVALIEALIIGKAIMLGGLLRLGRGLEAKPLLYPTLYKTVVFIRLVGAFTVVEHSLGSLWTGEGILEGVLGFSRQGLLEQLAHGLVIFVALPASSRNWSTTRSRLTGPHATSFSRARP